MRNADGFNLDVSKSIEAEENTISIRMNVRDIDEALQILEKQGYKNYLGDGKIIETNSQKCARMDSPFGYSLVVIEHIRKEDREKK